MDLKTNKIVNYVSLLCMTIITFFSVLDRLTTVFYILFLFWCDEFVRTFFDLINYFFRKDNIDDVAKYLSNVKSRFFFLFVYLVFIIVFFGLILEWEKSDLVVENLSVLFFKNNLFNLTIIIFIIREFYFFQKYKIQLQSKTIVSNGIITLHISIVLGILFWFISTQKILLFKEYATVISIIPFLLLKIVFEIKSEK